MVFLPRSDRLRDPLEGRARWYAHVFGTRVRECHSHGRNHGHDHDHDRNRSLPQLVMAELPADAIAVVLRFLTGFDLLQLSHVDRRFYYELLKSDGPVWQPLAPQHAQVLTRQACIHSPPPPPIRDAWELLPLGGEETQWQAVASTPAVPTTMPPVPAPRTFKKSYCTRRSIRFHGSLPNGRRGGAITTPSPVELSRHGSFSFDLWLALLPPQGQVHATRVRVGGIVFGAQSIHATCTGPVHYHQSLVRVDQERNLVCCVMTETPIVAEQLEFGRWYHVALVFDATSAPARSIQHVHLDGQLVHTMQGQLHEHWSRRTDAQIGTGFHTQRSSRSSDWYAFHGLVDECRIWCGALDAADVQRLAMGSSVSADHVRCTWSMHEAAAASYCGNVSLAHCTRPTERVVAHVTTTRTLSNKEIPMAGNDAVQTIYCW